MGVFMYGRPAYICRIVCVCVYVCSCLQLISVFLAVVVSNYCRCYSLIFTYFLVCIVPYVHLRYCSVLCLLCFIDCTVYCFRCLTLLTMYCIDSIFSSFLLPFNLALCLTHLLFYFLFSKIF